MTSVGTLTAAHRLADNGLPRWLSFRMLRSYGSVCATAVSFDLALDRIGRRIPTVASPPPIVREHLEVRRQRRGQRTHRPGCPVAECAIDQDDWRSIALLIDRDQCAVLRTHRLHDVTCRRTA